MERGEGSLEQEWYGMKKTGTDEEEEVEGICTIDWDEDKGRRDRR